MNTFLQAVINGISTGGMLALMVVGFSIIWGVLGVINFAHGEFLMLGAYAAWIANTEWGVEPLYSAIPIFLLMSGFGFVLQKIVVNRVIDRAHLVSLLVMFAVSIVLRNIVKLVFDADFRRVQSDIQSGFWSLGDTLTLPRKGTVVLIVAILVVGTLQLFLQKTKLGKAIRAAAQNREAAQIVGIDIRWIYAVTFAVCIGLTAMAGALTSPIIPVYPFMGAAWTLRAFVITALSGLGSIKGALGGALALGLTESLVATYVPRVGTNMGVIVAFGLLVVTLVARPQGLFDGLRPVDATAA